MWRFTPNGEGERFKDSRLVRNRFIEPEFDSLSKGKINSETSENDGQAR